jgi:type I restriction enzyme M protein
MSKLGPLPKVALTPEEHAKNNLPDALARWALRDEAELKRARTEQSFCVPKADIAAQGYDLSFNRYKEGIPDEAQHRPPLDILAELDEIEKEIERGIADLEAMLR